MRKLEETRGSANGALLFLCLSLLTTGLGCEDPSGGENDAGRSGQPTDAGRSSDAGSAVDGGHAADAGGHDDGGGPPPLGGSDGGVDGGAGADAGQDVDAGTPVNRAPVAVADVYSTPMNESLTVSAAQGVLANDTDLDGDVLSAELQYEPSHGVVTLEDDGSFVYVPEADFFGLDAFTYSASDGELTAESVAVTLAVADPTNTPPVAVADAAETFEGYGYTNIDVLANDSDADGDALRVFLVSPPLLGLAEVQNNQVRYTAPNDDSGVDTFSYTITDDRGGLATAAVQVHVVSTNDPPVPVGPASVDTDEDTAVTITLSATDVDNDLTDLSIVIDTPPAHGTLSPSASGGAAPLNLTYTPDPDFFGDDELVFRAHDGEAASYFPLTVVIHVAPVNDAPRAVDDAAATHVNAARVIDVLLNDVDVDGDVLSISAVTQGSSGAVSHDGARVTYTPSVDFLGHDAFSYTISDGVLSAEATVQVRVVPTGWFALGGSDFGDWTTRLVGDSATASGISASPWESLSPSLGFRPDGSPVVAWEQRTAEGTDVYVARWDDVLLDWVSVGTDSNAGGGVSQTGRAQNPVMVLDSAGNPVVAWEDFASGSARYLYIRRYDDVGGTWDEIEAGSATGGGVGSASSRFASIALDADDEPVVAWTHTQGAEENIRVKRHDAANGWVEVGSGSAVGGGISNNPYLSRGSAVAVEADGDPVVVWSNLEANNKWNLHILRFDAGAWSAFGNVRIQYTDDHESSPSLALDSNDDPVVVFQFKSSTEPDAQIHGLRWSEGNGAWEELLTGSATGGGISNTPEDSSHAHPQVVLDDTETPLIAWTASHGGQFSVRVVRLDAGNGVWEEVGGGSATGLGIADAGTIPAEPALAVGAGGVLGVAWRDQSSGSAAIYFKRFDPVGLTWEPVGTSSFDDGGLGAQDSRASDPSLAMDHAGDPVVAWADESSGVRQIFVLRWSASSESWQEVGVDSASGEGISGSLREATSPSVAVLPSGEPVVAWLDRREGYTRGEVFLKRFNRQTASWEEMGTGSATGDGLSDADDTSEEPVLRVDPLGRPVVAFARRRNGFGTYLVYVRRWDVSAGAWINLTTSEGNATSQGNSLRPDLAFGADGEPLIAVAVSTQYPAYIQVLKWNPPSGWQSLGSPDNGAYDNQTDWHPTIAMTKEDTSFVVQTRAPGPNDPNAESLMAHEHGGSTVWLDVATPRAQDVDGTRVLNPTVRAAPDGSMILVWEDAADIYRQIHAKRLNASTWEELGVGSATLGGLSNSSTSSTDPSLDVSSGGLMCVAWIEHVDGGTVSVRCRY